MKTNKAAASVTFALTALALFVAACGGSGYSDTLEPTATGAAVERPTAEPTVPPSASEPTLAAGPSATTEPTVAAAPISTAVPATPTRLTLVAAAVRFEQSSLTAPAGIVTIEFDNRDQGTPHNVHFFRGADASGTNMGSTEIQAGAIQQTLALGELPAGSYFFQCDVHPSRMMGTLTVS